MDKKLAKNCAKDWANLRGLYKQFFIFEKLIIITKQFLTWYNRRSIIRILFYGLPPIPPIISRELTSRQGLLVSKKESSGSEVGDCLNEEEIRPKDKRKFERTFR